VKSVEGLDPSAATVNARDRHRRASDPSRSTHSRAARRWRFAFARSEARGPPVKAPESAGDVLRGLSARHGLLLPIRALADVARAPLRRIPPRVPTRCWSGARPNASTALAAEAALARPPGRWTRRRSAGRWSSIQGRRRTKLTIPKVTSARIPIPITATQTPALKMSPTTVHAGTPARMAAKTK